MQKLGHCIARECWIRWIRESKYHLCAQQQQLPPPPPRRSTKSVTRAAASD